MSVVPDKCRGTIYRLPMQPNQSLQPTANPLRGLSAAELGRYAALNCP